MKFKVLYIFIFFAGTMVLSAQEYSGAIGLRGGISSGITYRKFLDQEIGIETVLSFRRGGMQVSLLRERFIPTLIEVSDNVILGFGFGGHVGFMYTDYQKFMFEDYYYPDKQFLPLIGIDGYFGLEYAGRRPL